MYKEYINKKGENIMKNVKKFLMFIIISTFLFASAQRINSLGGNVVTGLMMTIAGLHFHIQLTIQI